MHHGRGDKSKTVFARGKDVPLLDGFDVRAVEGEEIFHHLHRLGACDDRCPGIALDQPQKCCGVIGFHMVDDKVVEFPSVQRSGNVFQIEIGDGGVHRIEQHRLFIEQQIGIVGHPTRHGIDVFKQREPSVAPADVIEIFCDRDHIVHNSAPISAKSKSYFTILWAKKQAVTQDAEKIITSRAGKLPARDVP